MNLNDPVTSQLMGFIAGALAMFLIQNTKKAMERGRPIIVTLPGTLGALASIKREKLLKGVFTRKAGDEREAYVLDGRAAYPTAMGPLHIITDYGANLVAPSKDEVSEKLRTFIGMDKPKEGASEDELKAYEQAKAAAHKTSERFRVFDPLIYWRATKENDTEDYYAAQQGKPHWMEKVAPFLMIAVLALVGLVGFMLWKVLPIISRMG